jgi:hypothetical protein
MAWAMLGGEFRISRVLWYAHCVEEMEGENVKSQ